MTCDEYKELAAACDWAEHNPFTRMALCKHFHGCLYCQEWLTAAAAAGDEELSEADEAEIDALIDQDRIIAEHLAAMVKNRP